MADEQLPKEAIEGLLDEFLARRAAQPDATIVEFVAEHPEGGEELRTRLEALEREPRDTVLEPAAPRAAAPAAEEPLPGRPPRPSEARTIDRRYEVVRVLGEGGFGRVYLVRDALYPEEWRALKTILPTHSSKPAFESRFRNEIRVLRELGHDGIPRIYNDGKTEEGEYYYTMAFVRGPTLADVLRKEGPLAPERVVRLVRQMLVILEYAHAKGVVHRDLKPANVMLVGAGTPEERVKILDFGIAKVLGSEGDLEAAQSMQTVAGMGTPHYMSPEQIRGADIDPRSDLYALGIIIYQMCSGSLPFSGKSDLEIATARLERAPKPLRDDQAPDWLRQLVHQLLERDREKRPTTQELHARFDGLDAGQRDLRRSLRLTAAGVLALALGVAWILLRPTAVDAGPGKVVGPAPGPGANGAEPVVPALSLVIAEPPSGAHVRPGPVEIRGECRGATEVEVGGQRVAVEPDGTFRHVVELPAGETTEVEVRCGEGAGAIARTLALTADGAEPRIECELPAGIVGARSVAVRGRIVDAPPGVIATETVRLGKEPLALDADGAFERSLDDLADGEHAVEIVAGDRAGNIAAWSGKLVVDTRRPSLAWEEPPPARTLEPRVVLRGRVDDLHPASVVVSRDGTETTLGLSGARFEHEVELAVGANPLRLVAVDAAGNRSQPVEVAIERARPPVRVRETNLASGATFPPGQASVTVTGSVDADVGWVRVNGMEATVDGREFRLEVALQDGDNALEIVPYDVDNVAGEARNLTLRRTPLRVPAGCRPVAAAGTNAAGLPQRIVHTASGIELVLVADGERAFYIGEKEVTAEQYARLAGGKPPGGPDAQRPVVSVAFDDAQRACTLAGLRLPTVAEWELAAGGPEAHDYPWGGEWREGAANVASVGTVTAGSTSGDVSWCGALDMAGNVSEWCTSDGERALRGGSWTSDAETCRLSRKRTPPRGASDYVGFRACMDAP